MATNMFKNIYEVEDEINQMMTKTALSYGQLDANGYGPMTASTYGQAEMQGRALGGMLGGIDPRMKQAELQAELMKRHPDPRTKEDLLAVAKDAASMNLPDIQAQMLEIAAEMPDVKAASKDEISVIAGQLTLTQGSDMMLDQYLKLTNGTEIFEGLKPAELTSARGAVRNQFTHIIKGYEAYLGTRGLKPEDVNRLMFTNEGEIQNLNMFKTYVDKLAPTNTFAKFLSDNNQLLLESMNTTKKEGPPKDKPEILVPDESINAESHVTKVIGDIGDDGEVITKAVVYTDLSKNEKIELNNKVSADIIRKLSETYRSMVDLGIFPDDQLGGEELRQEQQDDSHQAWIGGTMMGKFGFTPMRTKEGQAYKHFKSQPKERFEEYLQDPEAYFKKYIVMDDGVMREDTSKEVISLWGLN
jgi:hypothetical protein